MLLPPSRGSVNAPRWALAASPACVGPTEASTPTERFDLFRDTLEAAQRTGAVRTDLPARELALVAWSLVHGLASLLAAGRLPSAAARVRRYSQSLAAVFFEGVAR